MSETIPGQVLRYYETIRHLGIGQIFFLLIKPVRKRWAAFLAAQKDLTIPDRAVELVLLPCPSSFSSVNGNEFNFLNRKKIFDNRNVDWNFSEFGLLWNYNLNYFDFLQQENFSTEEGMKLMHHFIENTSWHSHSYDPYPVSLRGINWIKFLLRCGIDDGKINDSLYRQYVKLSHETEKHLRANHLLENGFSLLFGAFYFHEQRLFQQAENILINELEKQILNDGAHFELSPMYHRIILYRVLDCINLLRNKRTESDSLQELLSKKASLMLSWLGKMTFRNGEVPALNDSANGIALTTEQLIIYARQLDVYPDNVALNESGYRKFSFPKYEIIMDAGNILASYNPGHAHADALSFCMNINDRPVIVDCGTSTYENNSRRKSERSTAAHNTVCADGHEQSDMWASFRVGRRARINNAAAEENSFSGTLSGFTATGIMHKRLWLCLEDKVIITDMILENRKMQSKAYLHFHPDVEVDFTETIIKGRDFTIKLKSHDELKLEDYDFAEGFNRLRKAKVAVISFSNHLDAEIIL